MRRWLAPVLAVAAVVGLAALIASLAVGARPGPLPPASVPGRSCTARSVGGQWLPDQTCTPGATNPRVTQGNIKSTICRPGWATAERKRYFPYPGSETVKARLVRAYGEYAGKSLRGYELDHLIPVSVGGDPADPRNLWAESPGTPNPKDRVEAWTRREVCAGRMTLVSAQEQLAADWTRLDAGDVSTGAERRAIEGDVDE